MSYSKLISFFLILFLPLSSFASVDIPTTTHLGLVGSELGTIALSFFVIAYALVMTEEITHLSKSKPVIISAGAIWITVAIGASRTGQTGLMHMLLDHAFLEYGELFLFLLVAMTYINTLEERNVFKRLRAILINKGLSYRAIFWLTGILAFFLSPIADNLTTALVMCSVIMAIGGKNTTFVALSCINIVVSVNAGGTFSPFGDITTLMVWEKGVLDFTHFFLLFVPSLVNYLIPASIMHFAVPKGSPHMRKDDTQMKVGGGVSIFLFLLTILTAVSFEQFLHLPPALGMMTGLGYIQFYGHYLKTYRPDEGGERFNIFKKVERAEWDTLLFFYGVLLSVAGLGAMGYLSVLSQHIYTDAVSILPSVMDSTTQANVLVGILSAIVDNIPVMYAVLTMLPSMSEGQWLLVTLTAGVGGSLLAIGSAAGVAIMGHAKGSYTFFGHLKWAWAIALGYIASIVVHMWINAETFSNMVT